MELAIDNAVGTTHFFLGCDIDCWLAIGDGNIQNVLIQMWAAIFFCLPHPPNRSKFRIAFLNTHAAPAFTSFLPQASTFRSCLDTYWPWAQPDRYRWNTLMDPFSTPHTVGSRLIGLIYKTINSDQFFADKRLILAIHKVLVAEG
jgi:hypothetical protein